MNKVSVQTTKEPIQAISQTMSQEATKEPLQATQDNETGQDKAIALPINESVENSIIPSVAEIERFMLYLNKRFSLGLPNNIIINIQDTKPSTKGFFMCKEHLKHYENTTQTLNYICLSSIQQAYTDKESKESRNLLYTCKCGVKIRTAKNEQKPLKAICSYCNSEFIEVRK